MAQATGVSSGLPARWRRRFSIINSAILRRVSKVALPTCGCRTTWSIPKSTVRHVRLVLEYIEPRAAEPARGKAIDQSRLVHHRPARDVDQDPCRTKCFHYVPVYRVTRWGAARNGHHKHVACLRHGSKVIEIRPGHIQLSRAHSIDNLHTERFGPARDGGADPAKSEDAHGLAGE